MTDKDHDATKYHVNISSSTRSIELTNFNKLSVKGGKTVEPVAGAQGLAGYQIKYAAGTIEIETYVTNDQVDTIQAMHDAVEEITITVTSPWENAKLVQGRITEEPVFSDDLSSPRTASLKFAGNVTKQRRP
ncbi:hypothetical protein O0S10_01740 [Methanocorpusculum sp. MG]|uniref:Uncharacterized protein n=1 Tax=Methanocorpusculum petauri TaxID=3002863 RepID=A0ABT4IDX7_9EURY|nr:hypothetical protein [Methanocorpusculum petauri]MCZ0859949.1 hypothetical protein [Methanocorpusculum petauri]